MKIRIMLMLSLAFAVLAGCQKESENAVKPEAEPVKILKEGVEDPCYEESYVIYGGQTIEVGTLYVANDEDEIFVTYDLSGTDWYLDETHVFVGNATDLPLNGGGNPKIGNFPYSMNHNMEQVYTYTFSLEDFEECFAVAAHAVVVQLDENGNQISEETAWADGGTEFPGKRWGWYVAEFCSEDCVPDFDPCLSAYAYFPFYDYEPYNQWPTICFTDLGLSEIGWSKGPLPGTLPPLPVCNDGFLYGCTTNGTCTPEFSYNWLSMIRMHALPGNQLKVFFNYVKDGYRIKDTYVYVGTEPLPMVNGNYSIEPEDFPFKHLDVNSDYDEYIFPNFDQNFYIAAFATFEEI